jgi:pilus assembly protein CpaE
MSASKTPKFLSAPAGPPLPVRLNAYLICPDAEMAAGIQRDCAWAPDLRFSKVFDAYPTVDRLCTLLHIDTPNTVILDVSDEKIATALIGHLRAEAPNVQIIATHRRCDSNVLISVMRLGLTEFLRPPAAPEEVQGTFARVKARLAASPFVIASAGNIYSFLPARPGVGATTTALNTAMSVSRAAVGRVFLGDFDLSCGLVRFMLKIENNFSIFDATDRVLELDESVWPQITHRVGTLDTIHAGVPSVNSRLACESVRQLSSFLRRKYEFSFADLSGHLEDFSIEIMKASKRVFIVTMPELTSLHQAREKVRILEDLGLAEKASIVLNRTSRRSAFSLEEVEKLVGSKIHISLLDDERTVQAALTAGVPVTEKSQLGKQYDAFARSLMSIGKPASDRKRRFIEYFYVTPRRYNLEHA